MKNSKALVCTELPTELKAIPGQPGYFTTRQGQIFSIKQLSPMLHSDGYLRVCLYGKTRGRKRLGIHQLIALAFLPHPPGAREVRHLDGDKLHNELSNLAWGTRQENAQDMARHGTVKGERNPKAILTNQQVIEIRHHHTLGLTVDFLAQEYGVSISCIERILTRRSWQHV